MTIKHNSTCRNTCYTQAKCVPKVSTSNNSIGHKPKCSQGLPSTGFNNSSYIQVNSPQAKYNMDYVKNLSFVLLNKFQLQDSLIYLKIYHEAFDIVYATI